MNLIAYLTVYLIGVFTSLILLYFVGIIEKKSYKEYLVYLIKVSLFSWFACIVEVKVLVYYLFTIKPTPTARKMQAKVEALQSKIVIIEETIRRNNVNLFNSECEILLKEKESNIIKSNIKGIDYFVINSHYEHPSFSIKAMVSSPIGYLIPKTYMYKDVMYIIYFEESDNFQNKLDY